MSKQIIKNYIINTSAKTITLNDFTSIELERLALITNLTLGGNTIYVFADPTSPTATVSGNVITLSAMPAGMTNTDTLRIDYDTRTDDVVYSAQPVYNIKEETWYDPESRAVKIKNPTKVDAFQAGGALANGSVIAATHDIGDSTYMAITVNTGGAWNAVIKVQQSDDQSLFTDSLIYNAASLDTPPTTSITANGRYLVKKTGRYMKAFYNTYTSGAAATLTIEYFTTPFTDFQIYTVANPMPTIQSASTTGAALTPMTINLGGTATTIVAAKCRWHQYNVYNPNNSIIYIQAFNKLAANITLGTTVPDLIFPIPANGYWDGYWNVSHDWSTGLVLAATTTPTGSIAPSSTLLTNLGVK